MGLFETEIRDPGLAEFFHLYDPAELVDVLLDLFLGGDNSGIAIVEV